jgi:RHS repeat-associated protein
VNIFPGSVTTPGTGFSSMDMAGMVVVNGTGYVAVTGAIERVNLSTGSVIDSLAGVPGTTGCVQGSATTARFGVLKSIDSDGTYLYVSDPGCGIRKVAISNGTTSLLTSALGDYPLSVTPGGTLYVAWQHSIDQVDTTTGTRTTVVATIWDTSHTAIGVAASSTEVWVSENKLPPLCGSTVSHLIKFQIGTWTKTAYGAGNPDGCDPANIVGPGGIAFAGSYLYAPNPTNTGVERIADADGTIVQIAGTSTAGSQEGTGTDAWFSNVTGIASDSTNLWATDTGNHRLRKIQSASALPSAQQASATTNVNVFPGKVTTNPATGFQPMAGMVVLNGTGYVAETGAIQKVTLSTGAVTTLAGLPGTTGCVQSTSSTAVRFGALASIDTDGYYLYASDPGCGIERISLTTGATSLVTNQLGGYPLTVASSGTLYVAWQHSVDRIDAVNGTKTTVVSTILDTHHDGWGITSDATYLWVTEGTGPPSCASTVSDIARVPIAGGTITYFGATFGQFCEPANIVGQGQIASAGPYLYAPAPTNIGVVRITKANGAVGAVAGGGSGTDAEWGDAGFGNVSGVASDGTTVWSTDTGNHTLRQLVFVPRRAREIGPAGSQDGSAPRVMAGDPVDTANGLYTESFTDITYPGIGLPFTFTRYYASLYAAPSTAQARFGSAGWTDTFDASIEFQSNGDARVYMPTGQILTFTNNGGVLAPNPGVFDNLSLTNGVYTLLQNDGTKYHFDQNGVLQDITDRNGDQLALHYSNGHLAYVIDSVGREIDFHYDALCTTMVDKITMPDGRHVDYVYTPSCQLSDVNELYSQDLADRKTTHYSWTGSEMQSITHGLAGGNDVSLTYYPNGRVQTQAVPNSPTTASVTTYTYTVLPDITTTVTTNGHAWLYKYSSDAVLQSVTDPIGNITAYSGYTSQDLVQTVDRPGHQVWQYNYNSDSGTLASVFPPLSGSSVSYTYDPTYKSLVRSISRAGNTTRFEYDGTGNLNCVLLPGAATTCAAAPTSQKIQYGLDVNHQVHTVTDPNNNVTTYNYFASTSNPQKKGLIQSVVTKMGLTTSYDYNSFLQQASILTPQGNANGGGSTYTWAYTYDDAGRLLTVTDPMGAGDVTTDHYDAEGNLDYRKDADNHYVSYRYLPGGKPCLVAFGSVTGDCTATPSNPTRFTYDGDGNLSQVTDGNGNVTTRTYWENGELHTITDPLNRQWSYGLRVYTSSTSQVVETLNSGDTVTTTYDALGRPVTVAYSTPTGPGLDPTSAERYAYDDAGNLCRAATGTGPLGCSDSVGIGFTYDSMNRMLSATGYSGSPGSFAYTYDAAGNLKSRRYPNGKQVAYTYDGDNRWCGMVYSLTPAANCSTGTINVDYTQVTAVPSKVTENFPTGDTITLVDRAGRLKKITNDYGSPTAVLSRFTPTLDAAGFPQSYVAENNKLPAGLTTETQTYTFDPTTARLNKICYDGGTCGSGSNITGTAYTYDGAGNVISKVVYGGSGAGPTYYGYDAANELCWSGPNSGAGCTVPSQDAGYTYTSNGDRRLLTPASGTPTNYHFDLAHRLTQAALPTGTDNYTYDALGNRANDSGTATAYTWDPNAPVAQLVTAAGTATQNFYYGRGLESMKDPNANITYYYDLDQTGSVANIVKGDGTVEYSYSYSPYGAFRSKTKNDPAAASDFNPMGFDSEYRDTTTTGFFDLRARMYDPGTANFLQPDPLGSSPTYSFASGNPAMFSDPSGQSIWSLLRSALDWFNEHLNPGYAYLTACFGSGGTESLGSWAGHCALGSAALALSAQALAGVGVAALEPGTAEAGVTTGDVTVYTSVNEAGDVDYVGITNNFERRAAEHLAGKGLDINPIEGLESLSRADARAVEQVLIEENGGPGGGQLLNKINSIASGNQIYTQSIERGCAILAVVGYPAPKACG